MKKVEIRALRIYDAITVNKKKEAYLISGKYASDATSQKKYSHISLAFYPEIGMVEIKDTVTKYHILVPVTNVAEMLMPDAAWDSFGEDSKSSGPGRPKKSA